MPTDDDCLNCRVTGAIIAAEQDDDPLKWLHVMEAEAALAIRYPAGDVEGEIARRGVVSAALSAGMPNVARLLADNWIRETHYEPSDLERVAFMRRVRPEEAQ